MVESDHTQALLERARCSYTNRAWDDAYRAFRLAEQHATLGVEDLSRVAVCAGLSARYANLITYWERLFDAQCAQGSQADAARTAFHIGFRLFATGEQGRGGAWISRCERIVERLSDPCGVHAYPLVVQAQRALAAGQLEETTRVAARAAELSERCHEPDSLAYARYLEGAALLRAERVAEGLERLDEAMLVTARGEVSPIFTGLVYCQVIACCQQVFALDRAREWTAALTEWCREQPQLVTFTGSCLVHRAELLELGGEWDESIAEAEQCAQRYASTTGSRIAGDGLYQRAEIHRLRGELDLAEHAYQEASAHGREPLPGLALLRAAQGNPEAGAAALRRVLAILRDPLERMRYLPASLEVFLQLAAMDEARAVCEEIENTATRYAGGALRALAAQARGTLALAEGDAARAIDPLQRAFCGWQDLNAPYIAARVRVCLGRAYEALGDSDGSALQHAAAREVFERLGAAPDLAASRKPTPLEATGAEDYRLTPRELEVLRLLATGKTNKRMARELFVSEKTIDRHVSNLFGKLGVSTRAAATAWAYENGII